MKKTKKGQPKPRREGNTGFLARIETGEGTSPSLKKMANVFIGRGMSRQLLRTPSLSELDRDDSEE
jgi:hypothetical protein